MCSHSIALSIELGAVASSRDWHIYNIALWRCYCGGAACSFKTSSLSLLRLPSTLSTLPLSRSVICFQFEIRATVPSEFTTSGPSSSSRLTRCPSVSCIAESPSACMLVGAGSANMGGQESPEEGPAAADAFDSATEAMPWLHCELESTAGCGSSNDSETSPQLVLGE